MTMNTGEETVGRAWPTRPGEVLLVGVCGDEAATLWALGVPGADVEVGEEARMAWGQAITATARWIPILWRFPGMLERMELRCRRVGYPYIRESGRMQPGRPICALDGLSFGLAFWLAQVSMLCDIPIPDVAATGRLAEDGRVLPVFQVGLKTEALARLAPVPLTWLVPTGNFDEALEAAYGSSLRIHAISTVSEAFEVVFGDRIADRLRHLSRQPTTRGRVVDDLFEMAWAHSPGVLNWEAVAEAARIVKETATLDAKDLYRVRFAEAVALRHHADMAGDMPVPEDETLLAMPAPMRVRFVAHLVQHCADTGTPPVETALRLVSGHLVRGREAFIEHLRLLGAYGRLLLVTGRPHEALSIELEAAEGFLARLARDETSRPLSLALWLAGVLQDRPSFARAENLWDRGGRERFDPQSARFVQMAWAAGRVLLGEMDGVALRVLECLFRDTGAREFLRWSAARHLVRAYRALGRTDELSSLREQVRAEALRPDAGLEPRIAWALVRLDEDPQDHDALSDLQRLEPGVVGHLQRSARSMDAPPGDVIARFYPY